MHIEDKRSTRYRTLVAQGVSCGALRQAGGYPNSWIIECWKIDSLPNDAAKEDVKQFLQAEWEATHITFFGRVGAGPNHFYARFVSYAL